MITPLKMKAQNTWTNKEVLYDWLKTEAEVQLEYPLPELKQIADVFVNGNLALEVQCSPLPQKILKERSEGYRSQGYQVLWLAGGKTLAQGAIDSSTNKLFFISVKYGLLCLGSRQGKTGFKA